MDLNNLIKILDEYKNSQKTLDETVESISTLPYSNLEIAKLDTHRFIRCGIPEAVFAEGKTNEHLIKIIEKFFELKHPVIITRVNSEQSEILTQKFTELKFIEQSDNRYIFYSEIGQKYSLNKIFPLIITAGTADIAVAMESDITIRVAGYETKTLYDVGVAGLHRILDNLELIRNADVIIAAAGMDGVLPGVIANLTAAPVIGVPVSSGYGTGSGGIAALMTMLNSCSGKLTVCNIDNGYTAGCAAVTILNKILGKEKTL